LGDASDASNREKTSHQICNLRRKFLKCKSMSPRCGENSTLVAEKWVLSQEISPMGLTARELALVTATHAGNYVVEIELADGGFWSVTVTLGDGGSPYGIDTTRGTPKRWRVLSDAIEFVRENCPQPREVVIKVADWIFRKQ
jgi:hypothetical protein